MLRPTLPENVTIEFNETPTTKKTVETDVVMDLLILLLFVQT